MGVFQILWNGHWPTEKLLFSLDGGGEDAENEMSALVSGDKYLGTLQDTHTCSLQREERPKIQFCIEHIFVLLSVESHFLGVEQKWDMSVCEWQTNLLLASDVYNSLEKKH